LWGGITTDHTWIIQPLVLTGDTAETMVPFIMDACDPFRIIVFKFITTKIRAAFFCFLYGRYVCLFGRYGWLLVDVVWFESVDTEIYKTIHDAFINFTFI
jgi:hypothetical protein